MVCRSPARAAARPAVKTAARSKAARILVETEHVMTDAAAFVFALAIAAVVSVSSLEWVYGPTSAHGVDGTSWRRRGTSACSCRSSPCLRGRRPNVAERNSSHTAFAATVAQVPDGPLQVTRGGELLRADRWSPDPGVPGRRRTSDPSAGGLGRRLVDQVSELVRLNPADVGAERRSCSSKPA